MKQTKPKNEKYFNAEDIQHFKEYAESCNEWDKELIYNRYLYKFIDKQIDVVMKKMNVGSSVLIMDNYNDMKQDLHIHIYTYTLPKIDVKRVQAIQNLIYVSVTNKLINILKSLDSKKNIKIDYNDYQLDNEQLIEEQELTADDVVKAIDNRINELKSKQPKVNCVAYTYLEYLHRYIIEHDYDASGFGEYVKDKMKIGNSQYMNLSHKLGFKTIAFKSNKKENITD